jgi:aryl-alcohol dehydrogenase-like predicted oxidoreductase
MPPLPLLQPVRPLGATGVTVPLLGYGTGPLGKPDISPEYAARCLSRAIDLGITYLDTSPDYGSEPRVGEVMRTRRDEVFLATKVNRRRKADVLDELKESLRRLRTDYVDLIQVHAVSASADLEQALAPDGAVAALEQARDEGLARFIGITGHARPELLARALERYPFDAVLAALGAADRLVTAPEVCLLPRAIEHNVGVIAMKVLGHGHVASRDLALRYSLGLPGVSLAIVGMKTVEQIEELAAIAAAYEPLTEIELKRLLVEVRPLVEQDAVESEAGTGRSPLFWLHDTKVMGWRERSEPELVAY